MNIGHIIFVVIMCAMCLVGLGFILGSVANVQFLHAEKIQKTICLAELQSQALVFDDNGMPIIDFNSAAQVRKVYDKNFFECFLE